MSKAQKVKEAVEAGIKAVGWKEWKEATTPAIAERLSAELGEWVGHYEVGSAERDLGHKRKVQLSSAQHFQLATFLNEHRDELEKCDADKALRIVNADADLRNALKLDGAVTEGMLRHAGKTVDLDLKKRVRTVTKEAKPPTAELATIAAALLELAHAVGFKLTNAEQLRELIVLDGARRAQERQGSLLGDEADQ